MATPPTFPQQPLPGGGDGYGLIAGAALRRDPINVADYVPGVGEDDVVVTAVHQLNTSRANPSIYLPQMDVTPGDTWKFSFRTAVDLVAAAGLPEVSLTAEWYSATGSMIHEDSTGFQASRDAMVNTPPSAASFWTPTLEAVVPANAKTVHVVADMQCVNPVNAWAIYWVRYELITA